MQSNNFNKRLMVSNLRAITIVANNKARACGPAFSAKRRSKTVIEGVLQANLVKCLAKRI